jgi:dimethylglycine dehydrogenase
MVGTEISIEYAAYESGLDRFIHPGKGDFKGRAALLAWRERGFANNFATLEVHGVTDADALGNNPIYRNGELVGRAREADLLINVTAGSVVRLLPPLVINDDELRFLVDTLAQVIRDFARDQENP